MESIWSAKATIVEGNTKQRGVLKLYNDEFVFSYGSCCKIHAFDISKLAISTILASKGISSFFKPMSELRITLDKDHQVQYIVPSSEVENLSHMITKLSKDAQVRLASIEETRQIAEQRLLRIRREALERHELEMTRFREKEPTYNSSLCPEQEQLIEQRERIEERYKEIKKNGECQDSTEVLQCLIQEDKQQYLTVWRQEQDIPEDRKKHEIAQIQEKEISLEKNYCQEQERSIEEYDHQEEQHCLVLVKQQQDAHNDEEEKRYYIQQLIACLNTPICSLIRVIQLEADRKQSVSDWWSTKQFSVYHQPSRNDLTCLQLKKLGTSKRSNNVQDDSQEREALIKQLVICMNHPIQNLVETLDAIRIKMTL